MSRRGARVAVLGAGLQGTCVAMDLARSGVSVDLYDRNADCVTQASLHNEGKIHLGYVYAKDPSLRSAMTMTEGAAAFGPLLEQWLGVPMTRLHSSATFNYAVHRDSQLTVAEFEHHLLRTHRHNVERIGHGDYFGITFDAHPARLSPRELDADYDNAVVQAVYRTNEVSIDPVVLAAAVRDRVATDQLITSTLGTEVHAVRTNGDRLAVDFTTGGTRSTATYDHVVNALWDGRLAVDATVGVAPDRPWLFRVKHFVTVATRSATRLPSTTIVLGPFGDIVDYGTGAFYLSWYPSGMRGSSTELRPPESIRTLNVGDVVAVRDGIVDGLTKVVPRVAELPAGDLAAATVHGGVIFAWGATDIDDVESGLHSRFAIGPQTVGRYHTIDTGKLTMAPVYARDVADRIRAAS